MTPPRVTVLMAVHDDERHLAAAIDSILGQTFRDFELVVVNDGSTDRSGEIAASYADPRLRLLDLGSNRGLTYALNHGLRAARGEFVARLDSDDIAFPPRLEKQVAFLDAHPEVAVVGSQAVPIDRRGKKLRRVKWFYAQWRRPEGGEALAWYRMFDTPLIHPAVMFRRAAVEELGGYDERHPLEQDAELWMRVARRHAIANIDEPLIAMRMDRSSMTGDPSRRERVGYAERKIPMIQTLLREGLHWDDAPRRIAELWVTANDPTSTMPAADIRELAAALDACAERFYALHPQARMEGRIWRHRASMHARLIEKAVAVDRALARSLFAAMFRFHPDSALGALPRLAMLFVLGGGRR